MHPIKACIDFLLPSAVRKQANRLAIQENKTNKQPGSPTRFWRPGRVLRIRFVDADPQMVRRVVEAARVWQQVANIGFEPGEDADAEIRIGFTPGATWSATGTDALVVPQDQPTANFGWLRRSTASSDLRAVVLHVFGHILGLTHEHQNPVTGIPWDRAAVYRYYASLPAPWTAAQVDRHLFAAYEQDVTQYPAFDPGSVMLLPVPDDFTVGGFTVPWPAGLSTTDVDFVTAQYPFQASSPPWREHEYLATVAADDEVGIPKNGGGATAHESSEDMGLGTSQPKGVLDEASGTGATGGPILPTPTPPLPPPDDAATRPAIQLTELRLDVAVPERAQVSRAFQIAVTVRQPTSPLLAEPGLPVVKSGEAQVVWQNEPFIRLRIEVSAPDCTFDGPNVKIFRLFPNVDSPIFYFNLTPKVVGTINIVVNLYQEDDALGSAGTNTLVGDQPVGDVAMKLESAAATKPAVPSTQDTALAAACGALAGTLAQIYFKQESIERIVIDCGLAPDRISFDTRADNTWSSVMREAVLQDRVEALIAIAVKEYPAAADLQTAITAYRQALG